MTPQWLRAADPAGPRDQAQVDAMLAAWADEDARDVAQREAARRAQDDAILARVRTQVR